MEQQKVERFIRGARWRQIYLDQEREGEMDRLGCEEGGEARDIWQEVWGLDRHLDQWVGKCLWCCAR